MSKQIFNCKLGFVANTPDGQPISVMRQDKISVTKNIDGVIFGKLTLPNKRTLAIDFDEAFLVANCENVTEEIKSNQRINGMKHYI